MSNGQIIWNYLYSKIGNAYGVAGLMGNLWAESNYNPNIVQGDVPITQFSIDYTAKVDNGTITREEFYNDETGGGGYGLAQWTYWNRKRDLYDMWKSGGYSSIGSMDLALDYLWWELNNRSEFLHIIPALKTASSIREAASLVLFDFEKPLNAGNKVNEREGYGQTAYNDYSGNYTPPKTYEPRFDESGMSSSKWYNAPLNPFSVAGFGLPNCTCYAWGRRGEITGEAPDTSMGDAFRWWGYNKENNVYPYGQTPKLGAICCWDYGTGEGGHVAIVEEIYEDGTIRCSNSAWGGSYFYMSEHSPDNNYGWTRLNGGTAYFQGFIYLPDDFNFNPDDPTPDDPDTDTKKKNLSKFLLYAGALDLF